MALITRLTRLFQADFHAVLDRVEEPRLLLRQAVREMEESLAEAELEHRGTLAEYSHLGQRRRELDGVLGQIDQELDVCFASDKEDLARELLRRKLRLQHLAKRAEARLGELAELLEVQRRALQDNRTTLESTRQKAELLAERDSRSGQWVPGTRDLCQDAFDEAVTDSDVEVALLQEKRRRAKS